MQPYKPFSIEKSDIYYTISNNLINLDDLLEKGRGYFIDDMSYSFVFSNEQIAKEFYDYVSKTYLDGYVDKRDEEIRNFKNRDYELTAFNTTIIRAQQLKFKLIKENDEYNVFYENDLLFSHKNIYIINDFLSLIYYKNMLNNCGYKVEITIEK